MTDEDIQHIDQRSYFITIPLNHMDEFKTTQKAIYTKIRKSFGYKGKPTQIGLILCGDVNGTRTGLVNELAYENPHYHGLILLPKNVAPKNEDEDEEQKMVKKIKSALEELDEVTLQVNKGNKIYVQRYNPKPKSMFQTVSYVIKADTNFTSKHADKFNCSTFPYDDKLNHTSRIIDFDDPRTQDLLFKLHLYPDEVFANSNLNHLTQWQLGHRQSYENAIGAEAKNKIKQRFLKRIRPTTSPSTQETK